MRRFFIASCIALTLCILAPLFAQACRLVAAAPADAFQAAFTLMAVGAPFSYMCALVGGIILPKPTSFFRMPLVYVGAILALSPLLLRALVAAINSLLPGYANGPKGMDALVSYLSVLLLPAGFLALASALTTFVIAHRRSRMTPS